MTRFLGVKNFHKFQHYRERNPVWIKFYLDVLNNYDLTSLPEAAQCQLFKFWLLAGKHENRIPYDLKYLKGIIRPHGRFYLDHFLASGELYELQQDASATLDPRARVRAQAEEVRGQRLESSSTAAGRELLLGGLTPNRRRGMEAALAMWEMGHDLPPGVGLPSPEQIDNACRDVVASCEPASITPRVLRGFLARAMRPEATNGSSRREPTLTHDEGYRDAL